MDALSALAYSLSTDDFQIYREEETQFQIFPSTEWKNLHSLQVQYLISDRKNYFDSHRFSSETTVLGIQNNSSIRGLAGRKVLMLIHGFGISGQDICDIVNTIGNDVSKTYDCVAAYLYPSKEKPDEYASAQLNARLSSPRFAKVLFEIVQIAKCVDLLAYGLGVFQVMTTLNMPYPFKIRHLYLIGGADEQENSQKKIFNEENVNYKEALEKVEHIWWLHSLTDIVEPWKNYLNVNSKQHERVKNVLTDKLTQQEKTHIENPYVKNFIANIGQDVDPHLLKSKNFTLFTDMLEVID